MALHVLGVLLIVGSLAYAAHLLGVDLRWVGVVVAFALGMGLIGIAKSRRP